jgi:hypothetical protein
MSEINYENIISQLKTELKAECAIANQHGIVISSLIKEFAKDNVVPQTILDLIIKRQEISEELKLKNINSFAFAGEKNHYLFTFSEQLILISKLDLKVDLAKFMPSISAFLSKLSASSQDTEVHDFSLFDFTREIKNIETALKEEAVKKEKYAIIKELIKYISK